MAYYRKTDNTKAQIITWNEFFEMVTLKLEVSDE